MHLLKLFILVEIATLTLAWRIIFPMDDDFDSGCMLTNGDWGNCRNIRDCLAAQSSKEPPQHCYFEGSEQFVCCAEQQMFEEIRESVSSKFCAKMYPVPEEVINVDQGDSEGLQTLVEHIPNGDPTEPNEFPYMVAIGWDSPQPGEYEYKCGGALISRSFILTAAHCAYVDNQEPVIALRGGVNLTEIAVKNLKHEIAEVIIHPNYTLELVYNDIALIKLKTPIETEEVACIWNSFDLDDDKVTAIGYGHTKFAGKSSEQLLKANMLTTSNKDCQQYYEVDYSFPNGIIDTQICAKDPEKKRDTCQGDSGGPIISKFTKEYRNSIRGSLDIPYVVGITSFGQGCAGGPPGIYTRVSAFIDWIESTVWPNGIA